MKKLAWLILFAFTPAAQAATSLWFNSSESSWVGQGQSFYVQPDDDYLFNVEVGFGNALNILIASFNSPFGPDWDPSSGDEYHYWTLDLSAPNGDPMAVGLYEDTARWPFQDPDQAGMDFSGDHRGNNRNTGFFEVLEITFDNAGAVSKFAVDFTQYGELNTDWWINGSFRFDSDIASVPVPAGIWLMLSAVAGMFFARQR